MERVKCIVTPDKSLHGADDEALSVLDKLAVGETVSVAAYRQRYNKFDAMVEMVFQRLAKSTGVRVRNVRGWIVAMTGRADVVTIANRKVVIPWSTSPRDMSAAEFEAFWIDAKQIITDEVLPHLTRNDAEEIRELIRE